MIKQSNKIQGALIGWAISYFDKRKFTAKDVLKRYRVAKPKDKMTESRIYGVLLYMAKAGKYIVRANNNGVFRVI